MNLTDKPSESSLYFQVQITKTCHLLILIMHFFLSSLCNTFCLTGGKWPIKKTWDKLSGLASLKKFSFRKNCKIIIKLFPSKHSSGFLWLLILKTPSIFFEHMSFTQSNLAGLNAPFSKRTHFQRISLLVLLWLKGFYFLSHLICWLTDAP